MYDFCGNIYQITYHAEPPNNLSGGTSKVFSSPPIMVYVKRVFYPLSYQIRKTPDRILYVSAFVCVCCISVWSSEERILGIEYPVIKLRCLGLAAAPYERILHL